MSNGIKQGDKVRVSKDIPQFYRRYNSYRVFEVEHQVVDIEDGIALLDSIPSKYVTTIPCKYLVKVGGEYKPKFKKGDKVRFKKVYTVVSVDDGQVFIDSAGNHIDEDCLELYTEPTEQAEEDARIRQIEAELDEFRKAELDRILHPEKYYTYEVTIDNVAMNWQRYEADLAKEVVLKTVNSASDRRPSAIAEYATDIAKAVVEGLKRK